MNINDVLEHFLDFSKIKPLVAKLYEKKNKAMDLINQDIHFRDLVVRTPPPHCYGESGTHTNKYHQSAEERLNAHISSLYNLANEDHRANFCEKTASSDFKLKKGMENHVTRLTMNEFSLYTSKPLTMTEFSVLDNNIRNMAAKLEPNVHVLLSSFAVKNQHGKILNMSMYVEGGVPPKIHSFCKNTASSVDIDYGNQATLFTQQKVSTRTSHHADTIISESGENIHTGSVFEVTTAGGAMYTQTIDVCLDHALGHSKEQIKRRILKNALPDEIIPLQIEQCVTSNWINIYKNSVVSDNVLHADPVCSMIGQYNAQPGKEILEPNAISRVIPSDYSHMSIERTNSGYAVRNPPFGSSYAVEVLAVRPAAKYLPNYQEPLKRHNERVIERQLLSARQRDLSDEEKAAQRLAIGNTTEQRISYRLEQLQKNMLERCKPGFWERIFKTEEYRQKIEARQIIAYSFDFMREVMTNHDNTSIFLINPWKKDMVFRLNSVGSNSNTNPFKQKLCDEIQRSINIDLKEDLQLEFEQNDNDNKIRRQSSAS